MNLRSSPDLVTSRLAALAAPALSAALLALCALPAQAQSQSQSPAPTASRLTEKAATLQGRPDQAIERIRNEDAGSRIDELRVGGQTQSITVQSKNDMPAYEIKPANAAQGAGNRVWNFLKF